MHWSVRMYRESVDIYHGWLGMNISSGVNGGNVYGGRSKVLFDNNNNSKWK